MNRLILALLLSIAVLSSAVKAQAENLPSFKKDESPNVTGSKDSVKESELSKLIKTLLISGEDAGGFPDGFAQAVGLSQAMPAKLAHIDISHHKDRKDSRECNVVYQDDDASGTRAVCVLFSRTMTTKDEMSSRYYRVSLDGQFENAVTLNMKLGPDGNAIPEGRSRSEEDITAPDTQKAFKAEMSYWVKNWLKKQHNAKAVSAKVDESGVSEHPVDKDVAAPAASGTTAP